MSLENKAGVDHLGGGGSLRSLLIQWNIPDGIGQIIKGCESWIVVESFFQRPKAVFHSASLRDRVGDGVSCRERHSTLEQKAIDWDEIRIF